MNIGGIGLPRNVLVACAEIYHILDPKSTKVRPRKIESGGWQIIVASHNEALPSATKAKVQGFVTAGVAELVFKIVDGEKGEQMVFDPIVLYTDFDRDRIPDVSAFNSIVTPGNVVLERLKTPEKFGSLYLPQSLQETYYYGDTPNPGMEPSVCVVLGAGADCDEWGNLKYLPNDDLPDRGFKFHGWYQPVADGVFTEMIPLRKGDLVLIRDGDGITFPNAKFGSYTASGEVIICGWGHVDDDDPGVMSLLPFDESVLAIMDNEFWRPLGKNVVVEVIEAEVKSGEFFLVDAVQTRPSECIVIAVGEACDPERCRPGDHVLYHPLGEASFYDPTRKTYRIIREEAVLTIIERAA